MMGFLMSDEVMSKMCSGRCLPGKAELHLDTVCRSKFGKSRESSMKTLQGFENVCQLFEGISCLLVAFIASICIMGLILTGGSVSSVCGYFSAWLHHETIYWVLWRASRAGCVEAQYSSTNLR